LDDCGALPVYDVETGTDGRTIITLLGRDVPALGTKSIRLSSCATRPNAVDVEGDTMESDGFRASANRHGITSIIDERTGDELIDYAHNYAGELILERDYGDPWATRSPDRHRDRLGPFGRRVASAAFRAGRRSSSRASIRGTLTTSA
jgi:hypothetical protein